MSYDYGDMARESARLDYERRMLREWGKPGDPPSHALELAEGRKAAHQLREARVAYGTLKAVLK